MKEQRQAKHKHIVSLQRQIDEKRTKLAAGEVSEQAGPSNVKDLRSFLPNEALSTPLDGILNPTTVPSGAIMIKQQVPLFNSLQASPSRPSNAWLDSQASEMFLRPTQLQKGEKALRIVDFLNNIVPKDKERTIADGGNTKLVVSYGPKKLRLEQVSISHSRIFHNLLPSNKLSTPLDVQNYLAYTIEIMELSNRYQWVSVLEYDDEFRHSQATYSYPWSFDSNHIHSIILEAISTKPSSTFRSSNRKPSDS